MRKILPIAAAILSLSAGHSFALGFDSGASTNPQFGRPVVMPRGAVVTTGHIGRMQTTTLPNGGGTGILTNNGNGTSTLLGSNGTITTVPTPR
jgi:hypothetical protein